VGTVVSRWHKKTSAGLGLGHEHPKFRSPSEFAAAKASPPPLDARACGRRASTVASVMDGPDQTAHTGSASYTMTVQSGSDGEYSHYDLLNHGRRIEIRGVALRTALRAAGSNLVRPS
jgi:hypothetical protein